MLNVQNNKTLHFTFTRKFVNEIQRWFTEYERVIDRWKDLEVCPLISINPLQQIETNAFFFFNRNSTYKFTNLVSENSCDH